MPECYSNATSVGLDTALRGPAHARELEDSTDGVREAAENVSDLRSECNTMDRGKTKIAAKDVSSEPPRKCIKRSFTTSFTTTEVQNGIKHNRGKHQRVLGGHKGEFRTLGTLEVERHFEKEV